MIAYNKFSLFCVNIPHRSQRKDHIISEFSKHTEFQIKIINPVPDSKGNVSLWKTLNLIIREKVNWKDDFFVFCEDDHTFTPNFSFSSFLSSIDLAKKLNADIICGGVSWFKTGIQISENVFWIEKFSGLQFTVIFKKFYQNILNATFLEDDQADYKICTLTDKKFVIHPFLSVQKDFGYSDVTVANNEEGRVLRLFIESSERLELLRKAKYFYQTKI